MLKKTKIYSVSRAKFERFYTFLFYEAYKTNNFILCCSEQDICTALMAF